MAFSTNIFELLKQEPKARDLEWEKAFFHAFAHSNLKILNEEPAAGPDGWPYLLAAVSEEATEPVAKVLSWLSDKGIGLVVNPEGETPDYVFSYGMIWNFRERGEFLTSMPISVKNEKVEYKANPGLLDINHWLTDSRICSAVAVR